MDLGGVGGLGAGELGVADDLGRRPVIGRGGCLATADLAFLDGVGSLGYPPRSGHWLCLCS